MANHSLSRAHILNVVLTYAAVASLWILLSDKALEWLFHTPAQFALASTIKGWLFILITALLLYSQLCRAIKPTVRTAIILAPRQRWPLLLLNLLILGLTGMAIAQSIQATQNKEVARIQAIADLKSKQITEWLNGRDEDARLLLASPRYGQRYRAGQFEPQAEQQLMTPLAEFIAVRGFSAASVLSPSGGILWQTAAAGELTGPLRQALPKVVAGQVMRLGPYLDDQGKPRLDFIVPLGDPPFPVIVLQIRSSAWLNRILRQWPIPDSSGEALLFRRNGDQVQFLNDVRYHPGSALTLQHPLTSQSLLAAQFLRQEVQVDQPFFGQDYRGIAAFGMVQSVDDTDWFLLAKVDKDELTHAALQEGAWIGLVGLLVLFIANAGYILLRQHTRLNMVQAIKHSQTERLQALQLLSAIADSSEDAIFAKDMAGRYILFNRAASQFVGQSAQAVLGLDDTAIFPPEQAQSLQGMDQQVIANNRVQTMEESVTLPKGDRTFLSTKGPLHDSDGKVMGIFGIARDITDAKRTEAGLREREGLFRALVEQSLAGIYIVQQGALCYINPGFARLFGYDATDDLLAMATLTALTSVEDRPRLAEQLQLCEREARELHTRFTARRQDNVPIEVEIYGRQVDYRGQPAVLGLLLDITERGEAEQALTRQAAALRQQNSELERFNKVMVDRELAMLALKHQLNELSVRLGEQPPYPQAPKPPVETP